MTHTQYLNDTQEFNHAIDLVNCEIERLSKESTKQFEKTALNEMAKSLHNDLSSMNVCVSCFSEVGDSLSQRRAYGSQMSGYAIGFCGSFLKQVAKHEQFYLAKCVYDTNSKNQIISKFVRAVLEEVIKHQHLAPNDLNDDYDFWHDGGNLCAYLNRLAPILKNSSFSDEREWRIISRPLRCTSEHFDYRQGNSMIIPYYKLPITNDVTHVGEKRFQNICVGPTPNKLQAANSVRSLLASQRLASHLTPGGPVDVINSSVPYRSW